MCKTSLDAIFWSSCDQREKANFGRKVKKMVPPTHDIQVPPREAGRADFRHDMVKPLGFSYVLEKILEKNFGRDFEEVGPTSKLTRACARLMGHAQPCEKTLGFAYGCAMRFASKLLQPRWGISFETFWKVSKLFLITIQSDAELAAVYRNGRIS